MLITSLYSNQYKNIETNVFPFNFVTFNIAVWLKHKTEYMCFNQSAILKVTKLNENISVSISLYWLEYKEVMCIVFFLNILID